MVRSVFFLLLFSIFQETGQLAAQVPLPAETVDAFLLVRTTDERFSPRLLEQIDILVIGNASAGEDDGAFLEEEIRAIREWVERGGRLLLVSDSCKPACPS